MSDKITAPPPNCPLPLWGRVGVGLIVACTLAIQQHVVGWVLTHQPQKPGQDPIHINTAKPPHIHTPERSTCM